MLAAVCVVMRSSSLAPAASRRRVVGGLGALVVAPVVGVPVSAHAAEAEAKKLKAGASRRPLSGYDCGFFRR